MGILDVINKPLAWIINLCYSALDNYALALLMFALIIKILLFPLGIKQQKNSIKQAKLRPKEMAIRNKYKGRTDSKAQKSLNNEIQSLYAKEGYNQLSGCLPLLIQLPILLSVFNVIRNPLRYLCNFSADTVNKIKAVSGARDEISALKAMAAAEDFSVYTSIEGAANFTKDMIPDFHVFGIDFSAVPKFGANILLLIPLITFIAVFVSSKLTRKFSYQPPKTAQSRDMDMSMNLLSISMPLLSTFITFTVPAIVGLYWIYQNVLGVFQQILLSKIYKLPVFTQEDYAEAERIINGKPLKKKKKISKDPDRPRVRSLHMIDDEQYNSKVVESSEDSKGEKKTESDFLSPVKMKDYSDRKKR